MAKRPVWHLYGVADRDSNEVVSMFFDKKKDLLDFKRDLPGTYRTMKLFGFKYDDLEIESV